MTLIGSSPDDAAVAAGAGKAGIGANDNTLL
jgi:hypothetical protein